MSSQQSTSQMVVAEQHSEPKKNITITNNIRGVHVALSHFLGFFAENF